MKAIAEIAKTTSIVQKENTLIDIKIQVDLTVTLATASITGYNKTSKWSRFASDTTFKY